MATPVIMPQQGNTVETCLIVEWKKQKGDTVQTGDVLCEVETDKAVFEIEAPAGGTLLDIFFAEGDDVPVFTNIAVIGEQGESYDELIPQLKGVPEKTPPYEVEKEVPPQKKETAPIQPQTSRQTISPRAKRAAQIKGIQTAELAGSGPSGRIIERDVLALSKKQSPLTQAAKSAIKKGLQAPSSGTGIGGRIRESDLIQQPPHLDADYKEIPVKGVRKLIADRMVASLQSTAQLTLNRSVDVSKLLVTHKSIKQQALASNRPNIKINDLLLYSVCRILLKHPKMNCEFLGETIRQYYVVHLAFAVDTPKGLMAPVIRNAHLKSLDELSAEAKRLQEACVTGTIQPDEIGGGTFTVTNLGSMGIEHFTPILNAPQVGILGVGNTQPKPVQKEETFAFIPHMTLSLTIDHQAVDGADGARFLKGLAADIEKGNWPS